MEQNNYLEFENLKQQFIRLWKLAFKMYLIWKMMNWEVS